MAVVATVACDMRGTVPCPCKKFTEFGIFLCFEFTFLAENPLCSKSRCDSGHSARVIFI
jgi:hypothetical protein